MRGASRYLQNLGCGPREMEATVRHEQEKPSGVGQLVGLVYEEYILPGEQAVKLVNESFNTAEEIPRIFA